MQEKKSTNSRLLKKIKSHIENPSDIVVKEYQKMNQTIQSEIENIDKLDKDILIKRITDLLEPNDYILIIGLSGLNVQIEHECYWNEDNKDFNPFILKNQFNDLIMAWSCKKTRKLYQFLEDHEIVSDDNEYDTLVGIVTIQSGISDKLIVFQNQLKESYIDAVESAIDESKNPYKYLYIHSVNDMIKIFNKIYDQNI